MLGIRGGRVFLKGRNFFFLSCSNFVCLYDTILKRLNNQESKFLGVGALLKGYASHVSY